MKTLGCLLCAVLFAVPSCHAEDGKRVALVIGNDAYSMRPLQNAVNDARAMDRALRDAGFRTILKENASRRDMEEGFTRLEEQLGPDDTALLFYAGHAVQIENENELIPVDFTQASSVIDAKYKAFSLARVLDELARLRHKRTIVIVDACRSNPIAEGQSLQAGLAMPLNDSKETYIAFSTSPNHVATDNPNGRNSYFTEALSDLVANEKDLNIDDVMTRVRKRVESATDGKQTPWSQSSLSSKFFFHGQNNAAAETEISLVDKWLADARQREVRADWAESLRLYRQVLAKKPGGLAETEANRNIPYVQARREAQVQFEAGKYGDAGVALKQAYALDPFASGPALEAINCLLLADDLDGAVELIHDVRRRASSADLKRTELLLSSLAPVNTKAAAELSAGPPPLPPLRDLFPGFPFGRVDTDASLALVRSSRADAVGQLLAALSSAHDSAGAVAHDSAGGVALASLQRPTSGSGADASPVPAVTLDSLHLEVVTSSSAKQRDLSIERVNHTEHVNVPGVAREGTPLKVTTDPPGATIVAEGDPELKCDSPCLLTLPAAIRTLHISMDGFKTETKDVSTRASGDQIAVTLTQEFGMVLFDGTNGNMPVYLDGRMAAPQMPGRVKMPVGRYKVNVVEHGKTLSSRDLDVTDSSPKTFQVVQQQAKSE